MTLIGKDRFVFLFCTILTAFMVFVVLGFLLWIGYPVLAKEGFGFLTGTTFSYETHQYGIFYYIIGTLVLTSVTLFIAAPLGVLCAIFLAEIASPGLERSLRPFIELLVGIPSIVYGLFGLFVLEKFFRNNIDPLVGSTVGLVIPFFRDVDSNSGKGLLLASFILAVMVIPTIVAITYDTLKAVPRDYREAAYALGATPWEVITTIVVPAAASGIFTAIILAVMRAMGETMGVVMIIGNIPHVPSSVLDTATPMTSKIMNDIVHHMDEDEPRSALFALGFVLFALEFLLVGVARLANKAITRHFYGEVS